MTVPNSARQSTAIPPTPPRKRKQAARPKQAKNTVKGASPRSGYAPPEATRWKPGQPSPNPHGRPRKLADLQELIRDTLAEEMTGDNGLRMTRAQVMIRTMLIKSPSDRIALLEYAFGKITQPVSLTVYDDVARDLSITPDAARALIDAMAAEVAPLIESSFEAKLKEQA